LFFITEYNKSAKHKHRVVHQNNGCQDRDSGCQSMPIIIITISVIIGIIARREISTSTWLMYRNDYELFTSCVHSRYDG